MLVGTLQKNLKKCQENLNEIKNILVPFARQPLFERKDGKKDAFLNIEDREERLIKRHSDIKVAIQKISDLLEENMKMFEMVDKPDSVKWINYIDYVDGIVTSYLYQSVGCR